MENAPHAYPEFFEVAVGDKVAFVPFEEAVANPELGTQIIQMALAEAQDWHRRYAGFFDRIDDRTASEIVDAISRVLEKRRTAELADSGLIFDSDE